MSETSVVVGGETVLSMGLRRTDDGIDIHVTASPKIEAFFKRWSGGLQEDSRTYGRMWTSKDPLKLWSFPRDGTIRDIYTLWYPCGPLEEDGQLNMTFLRMVGISEPGGIRYTCEQVASTESLEKVCFQMKRAGRRFYSEFIEPVHMQVNITTVKP